MTISDGTLYICYEGKFIVLDLEDRTSPIDITPEDEDSGSGSFLGCSPGAPKPVTYTAPVVSGTAFYAGSYPGKVYSINPKKERKIWKEDFETEGNIVAGLVMTENNLFIASDKKLFKLDTGTGEPAQNWENPFDAHGIIWATPVISDDTIYLTNLEHELCAVTIDTQEEKWSMSFDGAIASTPLIIDDTLFIGTLNNKFYALDISNEGELVWDEPYEAENWFWTTPAYADGILYAGSFDGKVHALDANSGQLVWDEPYDTGTGDRIRATPVIVGNTLVIGSQDDHVYGLNIENGEYKWDIYVGNDIMSDPVIDDSDPNIVYFLVKHEGIHAINADEGIRLWDNPLEFD